MSARIIYFPLMGKSTTKKKFEKPSIIRMEPQEKQLSKPVKNYRLEDLYSEMFNPDYFMLVE